MNPHDLLVSVLVLMTLFNQILEQTDKTASWVEKLRNRLRKK